MTKHYLSKSRILSGLQCPKRLYLQVYRRDLMEESAGAISMMSEGNQLGELARNLVPGGVLIGHDDKLSLAIAETRKFLDAPDCPPLFEATLNHDEVLVRADLLSRGKLGFRMVEVKSSTTVKDYQLSDCAVQAWVVEGAGYPLESVEVANVNSAFIYQGNGSYRGLLQNTDVTETIRPLKERVPAWIERCQAALSGEEPDIQVGIQCHAPFDCPFFGYCAPDQPVYPVTSLPGGGRIAQDLLAEGIHDIRDIPEGRLASDAHRRVHRITCAGKFELSSEVGEIIRNLPYPRYYLDFETISYVVPFWAGTRPYQQLPFQWSCHIEDGNGDLNHAEFLDTTGSPPMRSFAESLLANLGNSGPILVYSGFESGVINELAKMFPELAPGLMSADKRLVDLLPLARKHYYHPDMKGSWSIKAVLPTIAPELDYKNLEEVQNGGMAQMAYREIVNPETDADRRVKLTNALLKYCEQDTMAMVKIARFFAGEN